MNRADILKQAKKDIGYKGNPNVYTKWYCHDSKTHAWCGMYQKYLFKVEMKCTWLDSCSNFAYVPTIVSWAKKKGYWNTNYTKAKTGDLVIYNWQPTKKGHYSHVGMVEKVSGNNLISIEGNTTNALGRKNCVARKTRNKKYIAGVILLPYKEIKPFNLTRVLKKGCKGNDVKKLQSTLKIKADGIFGNDTYKAVKKFQKSKKIKPVDGIVGKNTAHALGWTFKGE